MYDKYIKALMKEINKKGLEVNYETLTTYSVKYDTMLTQCNLKFWKVRKVIDEKTKKEKLKPYCIQEKFTGAKKYANIIKYLMKVRDSL